MISESRIDPIPEVKTRPPPPTGPVPRLFAFTELPVIVEALSINLDDEEKIAPP